jgi:hypothetical protein
MPDLEITAQLVASIDSLTAQMQRQEDQRQRQSQVIRQVPITAPQANAAGLIDSPDLLAVKTGYYWSIRRLTLSGFTAGTCVVYRSSPFGEPLVPVQAAGVFTFGRGEMLLNPGDRLVVQATGITGYVQLNGAADCFEQWYLPHYIG